MKTKFRFDIATMLLSLIAGLAWSFLGGAMYNSLIGVLWTPLVIALYFLGLALFLVLAIFISNAIGDHARPNAEQRKMAAIVILALFLCSMLFEVLYELQGNRIHLGKPTSYIFLIDDSGSMHINDPQYARNDAVYKVMEQCEADFPFAVYRFTDTCEQIKSITPAKDVQRTNYGFGSNGGTDILGAIRTVVSDVKSGRLQGGSSPRILLLSDGVSSASGYRSVMTECIRNGISVSTVGFGSADREMLQRLAGDTRGAFVWAEDISKLATAMNTAATTIVVYTRDLLGYRPFTDSDWLFAVLRCVFLMLLAAGFITIKGLMFNTFDRNNVSLIILSVCAAVGALGVELLTNSLSVASGIARALMCGTFLFLLGSLKKNKTDANSFSAGGSGDQGFGGGSGNAFGAFDDRMSGTFGEDDRFNF